MMWCTDCGQRLVEGARFCHHCGARVAAATSVWNDNRVAGATTSNRAIAASAAPPDADERKAHPHNGEATAVLPSTELDDYDIWEGRFSAKGLFPGFAICFVATVALAMGAVVWGGAAAAGLLSAGAALWLAQLLRLVQRKAVVRYRLNRRRLLIERGFIKRRREPLELARIADVQLRQSFVERFLDVGSLALIPHGGDQPPVTLAGIDSPGEVADAIRAQLASATSPVLCTPSRSVVN